MIRGLSSSAHDKDEPDGKSAPSKRGVGRLAGPSRRSHKESRTMKRWMPLVGFCRTDPGHRVRVHDPPQLHRRSERALRRLRRDDLPRRASAMRSEFDPWSSRPPNASPAESHGVQISTHPERLGERPVSGGVRVSAPLQAREDQDLAGHGGRQLRPRSDAGHAPLREALHHAGGHVGTRRRPDPRRAPRRRRLHAAHRRQHARHGRDGLPHDEEGPCTCMPTSREPASSSRRCTCTCFTT